MVFSLEILKPILVIGHQASCINCSRALTKMCKEQKVKMSGVQYVSVSHEGPCHKNTSVSPAIAEEIACGEAAYQLLYNEDGSMKSTEEAIFADAICSDGDTRGSFKFIDRQVELLGECVKNIAEHIPDIGHLVKCISNGFYTFKDKNKIYGGVNMLDVLRIKSISADVSRHIRDYNKSKIILVQMLIMNE